MSLAISGITLASGRLGVTRNPQAIGRTHEDGFRYGSATGSQAWFCLARPRGELISAGMGNI